MHPPRRHQSGGTGGGRFYGRLLARHAPEHQNIPRPTAGTVWILTRNASGGRDSCVCALRCTENRRSSWVCPRSARSSSGALAGSPIARVRRSWHTCRDDCVNAHEEHSACRGVLDRVQWFARATFTSIEFVYWSKVYQRESKLSELSIPCRGSLSDPFAHTGVMHIGVRRTRSTRT